MQKFYSGFILAEQGRSAPEAFDGPHGWTIFKAQSTEIYKVTHNLGLVSGHDLRVVAMTTKPGVIISIDSMNSNDFTLSARKSDGSPISMGEVNVSFVAIRERAAAPHS